MGAFCAAMANAINEARDGHWFEVGLWYERACNEIGSLDVDQQFLAFRLINALYQLACESRQSY